MFIIHVHSCVSIIGTSIDCRIFGKMNPPDYVRCIYKIKRIKLKSNMFDSQLSIFNEFTLVTPHPANLAFVRSRIETLSSANLMI